MQVLTIPVMPQDQVLLHIDLIGKYVCHKFNEEQIVTSNGRVVSTVPEWFNIVYDNEPDVVYSFKLMEDLKNGDLQCHVL